MRRVTFHIALLFLFSTIHTKEVKVDMTGWPDFVFKNDHDLMNLADLEEFITQNNHLPGVPDEKEVAEEGIKLGEMNKVLLQKIEELTLYVIELKKENEALNSKLDEMRSK